MEGGAGEACTVALMPCQQGSMARHPARRAGASLLQCQRRGLRTLFAAASGYLAARWRAHPAAAGSGSPSSVQAFVATLLRRPTAPQQRSTPQQPPTFPAFRPVRPPRRGGGPTQRRVFASVFHEVAEQIETQPAIFLTEIGAVIFLSALFEEAEHWVRSQLSAYGDKTGRLIIDELFKEVTVLGFIGLLLFLVTKSGAADQLAVLILGGRGWENETENPLAETFETVHIMIFMLLVVLLFQSLAVLFVTRQVSNCWGKFERSRAFGIEESSIESMFVKAGYIERAHVPDAPRQTELNKLKDFTYGSTLWERLMLRQDRLHKLIMFRAIRHEFLYPRREQRSTTARVRDPALFSFGEYLRNRLGVTVLALVEINVSTWVATLVLLVPILYLTLQLNNPLYAQFVQCVLAWCLVLAGMVLTMLLEEDTFKFTPKVPEDARQILRLFAGTSTQMLRRASQVSKKKIVMSSSAGEWQWSPPGRAGGSAGAPVPLSASAEGKSSDAYVSNSGRRYRPGLGDCAAERAGLAKPPFFEDDGDRSTYLSSASYEQALRFIAFFQAISVTALIVSSLSSNLQDPTEIALYLLTWAEWPVMLFKVVPLLLRRLTIRNSIEGKKCKQAIRRISMDSNNGLLRDFLVLVRLAGLGRRYGQEQHHSVQETVQKGVADFETLNQAEQNEIWNLFAVWDADNTGQVELHEVQSTFQIMGFKEQDAHHCAHNILQLVDEDGSGRLTWRKLKAATMLAKNSEQSEIEKDLETFYELIDENGDGNVSVFELTKSLRRMMISIKVDDMANLLYKHFGTAKLKVSKQDFVDWAGAIGNITVIRPEAELGAVKRDLLASS